MFTRHRVGPTNKLDCPHAMGPPPQQAKTRLAGDPGLTRSHESGQSHFITFCCYHRPVRLLRGPQSLRASSICLQPTQADESSKRHWSGYGVVTDSTFMAM